MWWASVAWPHSPTPHHLALGQGPALSFHTYRILLIPLQGSSDSSNSGCTLISIEFGFIGYLCLFCFVLPTFPWPGEESVGLETKWMELASLWPGLWAPLSDTRAKPWEKRRRMWHVGSWNLWSASPSTISRGSFEKSDTPSCQVLSVETFKVLVQLSWWCPDEIMQGFPWGLASPI